MEQFAVDTGSTLYPRLSAKFNVKIISLAMALLSIELRSIANKRWGLLSRQHKSIHNALSTSIGFNVCFLLFHLNWSWQQTSARRITILMTIISQDFINMQMDLIYNGHHWRSQFVICRSESRTWASNRTKIYKLGNLMVLSRNYCWKSKNNKMQNIL